MLSSVPAFREDTEGGGPIFDPADRFRNPRVVASDRRGGSVREGRFTDAGEADEFDDSILGRNLNRHWVAGSLGRSEKEDVLL